MSLFPQYFDRIAIISLPDRQDRRDALLANLLQVGLASASDITWVSAVDGRLENRPSWWKAGAGGWGCRASQLATLQAAQHDGIENLLILEDDAVFHPRTGQWLRELMPLLPPDWDLFFLGGQHMQPPTPTGDPRIVKGKSITRTHAYAVPARAYTSLIAAVSNLSEYEANPGWHIDHQYAAGQASGRWQAYAPAWWLAAQEAGHSNIAAANYPRRWWPYSNEYWHLPFVKFADSNPELQPAVDEFVYIPSETPSPPPHPMQRSLWLRDIAREAWLQGRLPTCPMSSEEIKSLWVAGHRSISDPTELAHLADYPANNLFPHPFAPLCNGYHSPKHNQNTN